jgi:hypothetical protein
MTTTTNTQAARHHLDSAEECAVGSGSRLMALDIVRREVAAEIDAEVRAMRERGDSWARIGACLGTTKQAAHERFSGLVIDSGRGRA